MAVLQNPAAEQLGAEVLKALASNRRGVERSEEEIRAQPDELPELLGLMSTQALAERAAQVSVERPDNHSIRLLRLRQRDDKPVVYGAEEAILELGDHPASRLGEALQSLLSETVAE